MLESHPVYEGKLKIMIQDQDLFVSLLYYFPIKL